ncbi:MAG: PspC domain-containing protein [Bacteroidales bacterium]|nr:PspC domain-containing protein [Bacteroidales bacterium]
MNKTFTINLNGKVYHISEDGYEILRNYLDELKNHFEGEEGSEEIMEDIESRIGELFTERMRFGMEVVGVADVEDIISVMGHPDQIDEPSESIETDKNNIDSDSSKDDSAFDEQKNVTTKKSHKRLFRDPNDKIIGGVCSGLGLYLNIEPWILRVLFILGFFFLIGTTILIYVILWIVVPEAKTVSQKLEMRGESPNVENIKNAVNDSEITAQPKKSVLGEILGFIFKIFALFVGGCLGVTILMILFFMGIMIFPITMFHNSNSEIFDMITPMQTHYFEFVGNPLPIFIAGIVAFLLPLYMLVHVILVRTGKAVPLSKTANWSILGIWIVAIAVILSQLI